MPIAIHDESGTTRLVEEPFKDEAELQACLERSPYLLVAESEPAVATVQKEVKLPSAGNLDLLAVDKEGLPVAVEVKLARNAQSRREVVAQAFDYVAALSELTFEELDDLVDGALAGALEELAGPEQSTSVRKQCATNLRAGRIRLVIAVDAAGEDLIRIVRYITDHSDIDVRLVAISSFDKGRILVPRVLVTRASDAPRPAKEPDTAFEAAIDAYDRAAEEEWRTRGHGRSYRKLGPDEWPTGLHYEFMDCGNEVGVELHLELDTVSGLATRLAPLSGKDLVPGLPVQWDPRWSRHRGRLVAKVGKDKAPDLAARAMQELISRTRPIIEENLAHQ